MGRDPFRCWMFLTILILLLLKGHIARLVLGHSYKNGLFLLRDAALFCHQIIIVVGECVVALLL